MESFDQYIAPDGEVYRFDDRVERFLISFTGLGMPPIGYRTERGPYQHGETNMDWRLSARTVQLIHRRRGAGRQEWWDNRADLLNLLRPNRWGGSAPQPGILARRLPDGSWRYLDVYLQSGPSFGARSLDTWDEWDVVDEVRFAAGDPTFYDPTEGYERWQIEELGGLWFWDAHYPDDLSFDCSFGTDSLAGGVELHYTGTWPAYPTITIDGPLSLPVVRNDSIGEKIELAYDVAAGEQVTISLVAGAKSVTNNFGTNLVRYLSSDSDLATFRIAPEPEAPWCGDVGHDRPCGLNVLVAGGGGGVLGQTQVRMTYHTRYIGI